MHINFARMGFILATVAIASNAYSDPNICNLISLNSYSEINTSTEAPPNAYTEDITSTEAISTNDSDTNLCIKADVRPIYPQAYLRADIGWAIPVTKHSHHYEEKFSSAPLASLGLGYTINSVFRTDVSASYKGRHKYSYQKSKQFADSLTFMINGYLSIFSLLGKEQSTFDAYILAGSGIAFNKTGDFRDEGATDFRGSNTRDFAWNIGAGVKWQLTNYLYADLVYKYARLGEVKTLANSITSLSNNDFKGKIKLQEISIGILYKFIN